MYPIPIEHLIREFSKLPSVGRRSAERFVFYLLKSGKKDVAQLSASLSDLIKHVQSCEVCWDFSDRSPCAVCSDKRRDASTICVVAESQDMRAIERTGIYRGLYHILRGTVNTENDVIDEGLKLNELVARIKENTISEILLALNPDLRGETTMMFIEKRLKQEIPQLKITRLARGLPMGSDLQYADEVTLSSAIEHRIDQ